MKLRSLVVGAALACSPTLALADGPVKFAVDPAKSSIGYKIVHKFHVVEGKTSTVEGVALIKPEGGAQVQIKADVRTFDSGNANRDDHMKEATEANVTPWATIKGVIKDFKMPATFPGDAKGTLEGELLFHAEKHPVSVPMDIHFDSATHAHAKGNFDFSLDAYKVERPSLMTIKIEDKCEITTEMDLNAK